MYRLSFHPVIAEFDSVDDANDAARNSEWNNGQPFEGCDVELAQSTVTPETHPFICACGLQVAATDQGKCEQCDQVAWKRRE